jgi:hypothetical protein
MRSSFFHLRQSSISEDGQEKWRLAAAALPYLECLIPKRQGRGNRVATSHRLQISSATRRHGVGGMMTGTRRARSVTQEKRGQGERRAFLQHGKPLRTVGWQFQLDGICASSIGCARLQRHEDYYSWRLWRLLADSSVSPWHMHGPLSYLQWCVAHCSTALVQNAALQTCRAVKGSNRAQHRAQQQWQITMGRARSLLVGGCIRQSSYIP